MIICEDISFSYDGETKILDDLSLNIAQNSFYFIRGASGSGKSTLLSILSLDKLPTSGRLELMGKNIFAQDRNTLPFFRRKIGKVFQDFRLINELSVEDNIKLPLLIDNEKPKDVDSKLKQLLKWIGLYEHRKVFPRELSGGGQQRVAIARAIISKPKILLADEPTGNLDPELKFKIMNLFEVLNEGGTTILFATHDTDIIKKFKYPVLTLEDGKVSVS